MPEIGNYTIEKEIRKDLDKFKGLEDFLASDVDEYEPFHMLTYSEQKVCDMATD